MLKVKTSSVYKLMNQQNQLNALASGDAAFNKFKVLAMDLLADLYSLSSPVSQTKVFKVFEVSDDSEVVSTFNNLTALKLNKAKLTEQEQYFVDLVLKGVKTI